MPARKPIVIVGGQLEQLSSSDTLDAAVSEVDIVQAVNDNAGSITKGQAVYVSSPGGVDLAEADAQGTVQVLGLVADASISTTISGSIQTDGIIAQSTGAWDALTGDTGGLVPASPYYLSDVTAGSLTKTAPSTTGKFVVRVGLAISTTELDISVQPPIKL